MDLDHVNWGNYGLVVIDESHNFRNRPVNRRGMLTPDRRPTLTPLWRA